MKKYISPDLMAVDFKVEDIITVSEESPSVQKLAQATYDAGSTNWMWADGQIDLTD